MSCKLKETQYSNNKPYTVLRAIFANVNTYNTKYIFPTLFFVFSCVVLGRRASVALSFVFCLIPHAGGMVQAKVYACDVTDTLHRCHRHYRHFRPIFCFHFIWANAHKCTTE